MGAKKFRCRFTLSLRSEQEGILFAVCGIHLVEQGAHLFGDWERLYYNPRPLAVAPTTGSGYGRSPGYAVGASCPDRSELFAAEI